jgi:hypothetical protein
MVARAQGSGLYTDRTAIERGTVSANVRQTEWVRIFTVLASYMIAKNNVAYERTAKMTRKVKSSRNPGVWAMEFADWVVDVGMLYVVETLIVGALRGYLPDPDDEDADSMAYYLFKQVLAQITGGLGPLGVVGSELQGFRGGSVVSSVAEEIGKAYKQADQGEADKAAIKSFVNLTGTLLKLPSSQANRGFDAYWREYIEGEDVGLAEYFIAVKKDD